MATRDVRSSWTAASAEQLGTRTARAVPWGWTTGLMPGEEGTTLFMGDFGAKSDWFDLAEGRPRDNPESIEIFQLDRLLHRRCGVDTRRRDSSC